MFNVIRLPTKFSKSIKRLSNEERLQLFDMLILIWDWWEISPPDSNVWDLISLIYGEWMNMEARNKTKPEKSNLNRCSEWLVEVVPSDSGHRVEYNRIEENRIEENRIHNTSVSLETKQNIYTDAMEYLVVAWAMIDQWETPVIPEWINEEYYEEFMKFILYWSEKWANGKIKAKAQKTFELKRRFATWVANKKPYQNNSLNSQKTFVCKL